MHRLERASEHLDGPLTDPATLQGNLRDLRRINRLLGGIGLSRRAIEALADGSGGPIRVLDVGTGGADIPAALIAGWRRRGIEAHVTAIDSRPEVLHAAVRERSILSRIPELELVEADGLALPFPDRSFDIAHASLVLHHLEPPDATALLREMARVSTVGIAINDLARGRLSWLGAWLMVHLVTTNRFTRHDGPLSVRRAYSLPEAMAMIEAAGLRIVHVGRGFLGHRWAIAARV